VIDIFYICLLLDFSQRASVNLETSSNEQIQCW